VHETSVGSANRRPPGEIDVRSEGLQHVSIESRAADAFGSVGDELLSGNAE
jgi:hypothetical protein